MGKRLSVTENSMKKRRLACLAFAAPMFALAACTGGTSSLALTSNWYAQVGSEISPNTHETLTYSVGFTAADGNDFLSYGEGTYTTELTAETTQLADGSTELCYRLCAELTIPVTYTVNGESETFTDSVTSDVWFRDVGRSLQPVRSEKSVLSHSPLSSEAPETLESAYAVYEYKDVTVYDASCANAQLTRTFTQPTESENTYSIELTGSGTYLDNEQILFAMRGVSTSSAASFRSINPASRAVATVAMSAAPTSASGDQAHFAIGEDAEPADRELTTYSFSLGYTGSNPGQPQTLTYAAVTSANDNTYRSVLLEMEVPVLYSLGTLRYQLTRAIFS